MMHNYNNNNNLITTKIGNTDLSVDFVCFKKKIKYIHRHTNV